MTRARGVPGVISAAAVSGRPLSDGSTGSPSLCRERTWREATCRGARGDGYSPDYFRAMGVPLLRGRAFTDADVIAGEQMTAVVSERVVKQLFDGQDPIGRDLIVWKGQGDRHAGIVGVVGDMRERGLDNQPTLAVYFPYRGLTRRKHRSRRTRPPPPRRSCRRSGPS